MVGGGFECKAVTVSERAEREGKSTEEGEEEEGRAEGVE